MWSEDIIRRQGQVDKQYAGLKELAEDRKKKLDHTYHHFLLSREVKDLEQWIAERDVVASSQEMGQDLDHVTVNRNLSPDKAQLLSLTQKHVLTCAIHNVFTHIYVLDEYNYNQYFPDSINILDPPR